MTLNEILDSPVGEMLDMLSCFYVTRGVAVEVHRRRALDYDEIMQLR